LKEFNDKQKEKFSFGVNLRITRGADFSALFDKMKKSGFNELTIGLESGSERIRSEVLRRDYSNEDILYNVKLARERGFFIAFQNLVGLPGETLEDFKETIEMNKLCMPDISNLSIFFPYPGTDLYCLCKKKGFLDEETAEQIERFKATMDLPNFSKSEIQKQFIWFQYNVYKGKKSIIKLLSRVFVTWMKSNSFIKSIYKSTLQIPIVKRSKNYFKKIVFFYKN